MVRLYHYGDAATSGPRSTAPPDDRRGMSHHREGRPPRRDLSRGRGRSRRFGPPRAVLLRLEGRATSCDPAPRRGARDDALDGNDRLTRSPAATTPRDSALVHPDG